MNLTCWLLMPRGILVYKFRTRFMQNNPTKRALTAFSLLFNYGRTTGNQSANQHGVTQQPSMGQHHMLPGPSFELLLYHNIPGKNNNSKTEMSVTPCSCERNGNRRMGVLQTALLFQSGCLYVLLFVFFFFPMSSTCFQEEWLFGFTFMRVYSFFPQICSFLPYQWAMAAQLLERLVKAHSHIYYYPLILGFRTFSYLIVIPWKKSDAYKVSILNTFSWTPLSSL